MHTQQKSLQAKDLCPEKTKAPPHRFFIRHFVSIFKQRCFNIWGQISEGHFVSMKIKTRHLTRISGAGEGVRVWL